jgi:hypothetical protein
MPSTHLYKFGFIVPRDQNPPEDVRLAPDDKSAGIAGHAQNWILSE